MFRLLIVIITTLLLPACSFSNQQKSPPVPALQELITDLGLYKLNHDKTIHEGDLLEHSVWAQYAAAELIETNSPFAAGWSWTERDKQLLVLAGLLHDVGKAGRTDLFRGIVGDLTYQTLRNPAEQIIKITYTHDHEAHVGIGFEYLTHHYRPLNQHRIYQLATGIGYRFQTLFNQLDVPMNEQKIIAILVGIHYDFGRISRGDLTMQGFLDNLQEYATFVQYGPVDEYLLRLAVLIQVADVMSISYVKPRPTWLFPDAPNYKVVKAMPVKAWEKFGYASGKALTTWHALLQLFKNQKNRPIALATHPTSL